MCQFSTESAVKMIDAVVSQRQKSNEACRDIIDNTIPLAKEIAKRRIESDTRQQSFNVFDFIHRKNENFHSDIVAFFLNHTKNHGLGNAPLRLFIDLINRVQPALQIDARQFNNAVVEREPGRIDILISNNTDHIIIENKIKWAADQPAQLCRYWNTATKLNGKKHNVRAVVYITPDGHEPSAQSLGDAEQEINKVLVCMPAYPVDHTDTDTNLNYGWVRPLRNHAKDIHHNMDIISFLGQYIIYLEEERGNIMSNEQSIKFADEILAPNGDWNIEHFEVVRSMNICEIDIRHSMRHLLKKRLKEKIKSAGLSVFLDKMVDDNYGGQPAVCFVFISVYKNGEQRYGIDLWECDWGRAQMLSVFPRDKNNCSNKDLFKSKTEQQRMEDILRNIPHKENEQGDRFVVFHNGQGHFPFADSPDEFCDQVIEILRRFHQHAEKIDIVKP